MRFGWILRPFVNVLRRPPVRYRLLPALETLLRYDRKEEILNRCLAFADFSKLDGDYLEFGIWKGGSIIAAYHLAKRYKNLASMHFYGFDSFEGLPQISGLDVSHGGFKGGAYQSSLEEVEKNLTAHRVDMARVELIEGWYNQVLNEETRSKLPIKRASVVYVDCDLYESTVPVLEFITPYVVDGTVIIFDDWFCYRGRADRGEQQAFREWLRNHQEFHAMPYHTFGWAGNSFIVHLRESGDLQRS